MLQIQINKDSITTQATNEREVEESITSYRRDDHKGSRNPRSDISVESGEYLHKRSSSQNNDNNLQK